VLRCAGAANAKVRKTNRGRILEIHIIPVADDSGKKSIGLNSLLPTYKEPNPGCARKLVTLKRVDAETGALVRYDDQEGFTPGRFNPDNVVCVPAEKPVHSRAALRSTPADPATHPHVPGGCYCGDQSKPKTALCSATISPHNQWPHAPAATACGRPGPGLQQERLAA